MTRGIYRYSISADVEIEDVKDSITLGILATECLHGSARTRLELQHRFNPSERICTVSVNTIVGRDFCRIFTGLLQRGFGQKAFQVEHT